MKQNVKMQKREEHNYQESSAVVYLEVKVCFLMKCLVEPLHMCCPDYEPQLHGAFTTFTS